MIYNNAVVIGRFQPFHKGHQHLVNEALDRAKNVHIFVTSYDYRTFKNPFSFQEIKSWLQVLFCDYKDRLYIHKIVDIPGDDQAWKMQILQKMEYAGEDAILVGFKKDDSSYYLDLFPEFQFEQQFYIDRIDATTIRKYFFMRKIPGAFDYYCERMLDEYMVVEMNKWRRFYNPLYETLCEDYEYYESYPKNKFPPIYCTVDTVVVKSGNVLLVQRAKSPGKGLWALPGGFVEQNETLKDAAIRELIEETQINEMKELLYESIQCVKIFDNPGRSLRGRVVTHAYLLKLMNGPLEDRFIRNEEVIQIKWMPLDSIDNIRLFEDHNEIIKTFIKEEGLL